jgi:hypothetical protein
MPLNRINSAGIYVHNFLEEPKQVLGRWKGIRAESRARAARLFQ